MKTYMYVMAGWNGANAVNAVLSGSPILAIVCGLVGVFAFVMARRS